MIHLVGTGFAHQRSVPGHMAADTWCFGGLKAINPLTNEIMGTATDCVSDIQDNNGTLFVQGTTFLNLPGGTLVIQGPITLAPLHPGHTMTTENGMNVTHVTGSAGQGNINGTESSGFFEEATGNSRLSGMLDMSRFAFNVGDTVDFSCFFYVTDLKTQAWTYNAYWQDFPHN